METFKVLLSIQKSLFPVDNSYKNKKKIFTKEKNATNWRVLQFSHAFVTFFFYLVFFRNRGINGIFYMFLNFRAVFQHLIKHLVPGKVDKEKRIRKVEIIHRNYSYTILVFQPELNPFPPVFRKQNPGCDLNIWVEAKCFTNYPLFLSCFRGVFFAIFCFHFLIKNGLQAEDSISKQRWKRENQTWKKLRKYEKAIFSYVLNFSFLTFPDFSYVVFFHYFSH